MITVTITGADDATDPSELIALSRAHPFVEWGLLISTKRAGSPRYPSAAWLDAWAPALHKSGARLSMHMCGHVARLAMTGYADPLREFRRVQINGYGPKGYGGLATLSESGWHPWIILQCRSAETFESCCSDAIEVGEGCGVLYDPSGGTGVRGQWPDVLRSFGVEFGIAGGIGPDNVEDALAAAERLGASWVDMESGVRTSDRLDIHRVRAVLETAAEARP
jgi:phosphoribosylanthranilate isomerase